MATSTVERLAEALYKAGAPTHMVERARAGQYDDFKSPSPTPLHDLVDDLNKAAYSVPLSQRGPLLLLAHHAREGVYDASTSEAEAWMRKDPGINALLGVPGSPFDHCETAKVLK